VRENLGDGSNPKFQLDVGQNKHDQVFLDDKVDEGSNEEFGLANVN
jgi:hypothetical protein